MKGRNLHLRMGDSITDITSRDDRDDILSMGIELGEVHHPSGKGKPMNRLSRKDFLRVSAFAASSLFFASCQNLDSLTPTPTSQSESEQPTQDRVQDQNISADARPNIVFILTDDLDRDAMTNMQKVQTLVGDQGVTFSNFLISMPLCCPSRASILRGQYGHNTQIMGNDLPQGGFLKFNQLGNEDSTVATWLQGAGYRTMLAGKYLNAFPSQDEPMYIPPGWTEWYSPMAGEPYKEYDYTLNENGTEVNYGLDPEDYGTDVYAQKTIDFIERATASGQPFFAHVSVYAPHWPTTPAPRHKLLYSDVSYPRSPNFNEADVSDKPSYIRELPPLTEEDISKIDLEWRLRLQAMQAVDEMVEAVVQTLESTGQLDNTYIFFVSDNGFHFGSHRQVLGKTSPYEEEIRVPMLVRGPGIPAGSTLDHLVGNIDLAPTWAEIAGVTPPDFVDGRSLVTLLNSTPTAISNWRQCYLLEHAPYDLQSSSTVPPVNHAERRISLIEPQGPGGSFRPQTSSSLSSSTEALPYRALRSQQFLYVEYPTGEVELYDLGADPYQLENIANLANPQLVEPLSIRLGELAACAGSNCRSVEDKEI